jgi:DNA-binding NarL/FixJ family response regulator
LSQYPDVPFIFVSGVLGEELAVELLKKGATAYVLKNNLLRLAPSVKHYDLTPREIQIATLVKAGRTTKEMTEYLNISAIAVDFHRNNIRLKLGIKNTKTNLRSFLLSMSS